MPQQEGHGSKLQGASIEKQNRATGLQSWTKEEKIRKALQNTSDSFTPRNAHCQLDVIDEIAMRPAWTGAGREVGALTCPHNTSTYACKAIS